MGKLAIVVAMGCVMMSMVGYAAPAESASVVSISNYSVSFPKSVLGSDPQQFQVRLSFNVPECNQAHQNSCVFSNAYLPVISSSSYSVESACVGGACRVSMASGLTNIPVAFFSMSQFYVTLKLVAQNGSGSSTTFSINAKTMSQFDETVKTLSVDVVSNDLCYLYGS